MAVTDSVRDLLAPVLAGRGFTIYDLIHAGGVLRITVDKPGGVNLDEVADATRVVSRLLDDHNVVPGRYTLEVSSPGLERPLRLPSHYTRAVGETVSVKLAPHVEGERRLQGLLEACDDTGITLQAADGSRRIAYSDIAKARTVFEWASSDSGASPTHAPQRSNA